MYTFIITCHILVWYPYGHHVARILLKILHCYFVYILPSIHEIVWYNKIHEKHNL
jgi:hypothetical protein